MFSEHYNLTLYMQNFVHSMYTNKNRPMGVVRIWPNITIVVYFVFEGMGLLGVRHIVSSVVKLNSMFARYFGLY